MKITNMKATAKAPSNIAFIKYWGKQNETLRIPLNGSISVNLSNQYTITTVEFSSIYKEDTVLFNGEVMDDNQRILEHVDRLKVLSQEKNKVKVVTRNNFPTASGLASSASGFAALTVATAAALDLPLSQKELTVIARMGSGSACRSIPDGFVEWLKGKANQSASSFAYSLHPEIYWDISIITVLVGADKKGISSTSGQQRAMQSLFLPTRLKHMKSKIQKIKKYMREKDFVSFGQLIESEALEMHTIALTSSPPILYWNASTISIMNAVWNMRKMGIQSYFTIDAGPHLHIIVQKKQEQLLIKKLKEIQYIKNMILNHPAKGAYLIKEHLF